jgi:serpin B
MKAVKYVFLLLVVVGYTTGCIRLRESYGGQGAVDKPDTQIKTGEQTIVEGNNEFALALFTKLREKEGNLFFSPYSISTALAMTYAGAKGQTETQMAKVLCFPALPAVPDPVGEVSPSADRQQFASAFGKIIKGLNDRGRKGGYELTVANALWGQEDYEFLKEFLELIETNYDGRLNKVDFVTAAESARKTINAWVEEKTNNKIKDLIAQGVLNRLTRLVLTNAIYFKGSWAKQFEKDRTKEAPFTQVSGDKVDVPMMNEAAEFGYMETEDFQGLELPYVDNELSMIIFLPKTSDVLSGYGSALRRDESLPKGDGLADFEKKLTTENLSQWLTMLLRRKVIVSIPKFRITDEFSLASVLKSMGMTDAFTPDVADFSGMNGKRDLFISAVVHKAYVDVDEEGTEAAAATGVVVGITSAGPQQTPVFRADHPFLFIIRDNQSGSILFIGRVMNPRT